ncbi:TPA: hypothetical protein ACSTLU_001778 [Serratia fonticola]
MNTLLTIIIILGVIEIGLLARLVCRFRRSYDRKYPQPEERNYD